MATGRTTWGSYGRTRRPKNIAGADGTAVSDIADLAAAKAVTDASTNADKTGPGVYATENQRFLHLSSAAAGTVVNVWVYHYASAKWSELLSAAGATITLAATKCKIIEIAGVDLVAFKVTNAADVHASCSSF